MRHSFSASIVVELGLRLIFRILFSGSFCLLMGSKIPWRDDGQFFRMKFARRFFFVSLVFTVYCFLAWHFYDFLDPFFTLKGQLLIRYVQILKVKLTWKLRSGSINFTRGQIAIFCKIFVKLKGDILSQSIRRVILNCKIIWKIDCCCSGQVWFRTERLLRIFCFQKWKQNLKTEILIRSILTWSW